MRSKWYIATMLVALFVLSGCHGHLHHIHAPGHDPDGPGNSENAQGQQ